MVNTKQAFMHVTLSSSFKVDHCNLVNLYSARNGQDESIKERWLVVDS